MAPCVSNPSKVSTAHSVRVQQDELNFLSLVNFVLAGTEVRATMTGATVTMTNQSAVTHKACSCRFTKPFVAAGRTHAKFVVCKAHQIESAHVSRRNLAALIGASPLLFAAQKGQMWLLYLPAEALDSMPDHRFATFLVLTWLQLVHSSRQTMMKMKSS